MIHILFANWGLKSSFKAFCDHKSSYSDIRILISSCHVWPTFEFNHANCCRIHILFANWCLKSSFKAVCDHKKSYSELRILINPCHVWPKFECTPKFGGQTGVFAYLLLSDFHSFCNLGPKVVVQSRMWPEQPHSMQVSNKKYTQQSSDVDSLGLVFAGIYCFAIPAGATRGRMANCWAIVCYPLNSEG